ncbi:MAG TPA: hypothetical protein VKP78_06405 [bacterium]|nr:hypothetical protein [bacterium]
MLTGHGIGAEWLLTPTSPTFRGMGEIGVCLPSEDISSQYFNPANGLYGTHGISFKNFATNIGWLPFKKDISYENRIFAISCLPDKYSFKVILSYSNKYFYWEESTLATEYSQGHSENINLALRYKFQNPIPIHVSIGITRKNVSQEIFDYQKVSRSENIFFDTGLLISSPLKLLPGEDNINLAITPSLGYSISNLGNDISFQNKSGQICCPRYVQIGAGISIKLYNENSGWTFLEYRGGRAAADLLAKYNHDEQKCSYSSGLGDINLRNHVLLSKNQKVVELKRGNQIKILDVVGIRFGLRIDKNESLKIHEWGLGFDSDGLFYLFNSISRVLVRDKVINKIPRYFSFRYDYPIWDDESGKLFENAEYAGFTISINHIDEIISSAYKKFN